MFTFIPNSYLQQQLFSSSFCQKKRLRHSPGSPWCPIQIAKASLQPLLVERCKKDILKVQRMLQNLPPIDPQRSITAALTLALAFTLWMPTSSLALTRSDIRSLTYDQVKGTGIASRCPEVDTAKGIIKLDKNKKYKLVDLCLEPKSFQVEEEYVTKRGKGESRREFVDAKLVTRATYTLSNIEGTLNFEDNDLVFREQDGLDYAACTVQLPGGERVPFLFSIKKLVAKASGVDQGINTATEFGGQFKVTGYRTGLFLDPKGRGGTSGYDMAVALPAKEADGAEGQEDLLRENNKIFDVTDGSIEMAVNKLDPSTGEIAGVFVSEQLSDTDMGAKDPKKVLLKGIFYGRVVEDDAASE
ncbi:hypothetical protein GAYE_SCF18G3872 [Galdieria yellowstonensis]|uniref:Uncharacterized protein n=1 Tax=Galdieria yellowstonensis TaxID=3028027 RepID=A0AAV9IF38_9RHOD|nr:hypothetical protein GAYE_SCF18G3872 [Galdieria yellowstonensis]